jgi:hypothetical protein
MFLLPKYRPLIFSGTIDPMSDDQAVFEKLRNICDIVTSRMSMKTPSLEKKIGMNIIGMIMSLYRSPMLTHRSFIPMDFKYFLANGWRIVESSIGIEFRKPTSAVLAPRASANGVEYVPVYSCHCGMRSTVFD